MKALVLALLIPVAVCTACSKKEDSAATTAPDSASVTPAPTPSPPPAPAPAAVDMAPNAAAARAASLPAPAAAHVSLTSAAGSSVKGDLAVINEGDAVYIRGEITGLAPGKEHGFQVHEVGKCSLPDFSSAGGNFNPTKAAFGEQLGNLPNATADENGHATVNLLVKGPTLVDKDGAPSAIFGKALVVHSMPNDYRKPSQGAGARIACGVIR